VPIFLVPVKGVGLVSAHFCGYYDHKHTPHPLFGSENAHKRFSAWLLERRQRA